jgi:hypothetical protein
MKKQLTTLGVFCALFVAVTTARAQDIEIVLAELGGVQMISIPQPNPAAGVLATKVVLRATDPSASLVTFENLAIRGDVHQAWLSGPFGTPTAKGAPQAGATYDAAWIPFDSYVIITDDQVGGGAGGSYGGINETNDGSTPAVAAMLPLLTPGDFPALTGIGDIAMGDPTDAFFLKPEFQNAELELAYLVTPEAPVGGVDGGVTVTLGVLGAGIIDSGQPGGASFGFNGNEPVVVQFVPEPATGLMAGMLASLVLLGIRRRRNG